MRGRQRLPKSINKRQSASVFETLAILDDTAPDAATGAAKPMETRVADAKHWVDENEL